MTTRLVCLMAALCCAAMGCQQQPAESPGNGVSTANDAIANQPATNDANAVLAAAGVPTGEVCGGIAGAQCALATDFCRMDAGVCKATTDPEGLCTPKPESCTEQDLPVCGCDGKTYGNACKAHMAGVSLASPGECPTT